MKTSPDGKSKSELRQEEIDRLRLLPSYPERPVDDETGVLLSDRIKYYIQEYKLISPVDEAKLDKLLQPAGFELSVGEWYSIAGERIGLDHGKPLVINPFQVAVIETLETLNMPPFLIGRWNIRVKLAYEGLLWVGGAQVDPGFRGHLCCPIYNLANKEVILRAGDPLAMIDFVTTTRFEKDKCKEFKWDKRKMIVFQEYPALSSGIADRVGEINQQIGTFNTRLDTFQGLTFAVVAVLFAGLGIVATTLPPERAFIDLPTWIAAVALYFALLANVPRPDSKGKWYKRPSFALALTLIVVMLAILSVRGYQADRYFRTLQEQIDELRQPRPAPE